MLGVGLGLGARNLWSEALPFVRRANFSRSTARDAASRLRGGGGTRHRVSGNWNSNSYGARPVYLNHVVDEVDSNQ